MRKIVILFIGVLVSLSNAIHNSASFVRISLWRQKTYIIFLTGNMEPSGLLSMSSVASAVLVIFQLKE